MTDMSHLSVDIKPSKFTLYFFIAAHALAVLSILLINDLGAVGALLKLFIFLFILVSFKRCLNYHQNNIHLHLKTDDLVDLNIGGREYHDLQLSGESYVSDIILLLLLSDVNSNNSYTITILPDSLDTAMHSQLRARLKLASKVSNNVLA